ncbi:heavy metal-associated isoprenylated plant protein 12-like [Primulina eburnea]|uniref:heavy metal-associated isoprenylated plant protein 12-like n=1 Tax=Primulina eburnea TaxID=1245227 RepID=UPI003C6C2AF8
MSGIYDNWERLVEVVLRREQFRQLCLADSRSPSIQSTSSSNSHLGNEFEEHGEAIYKLVSLKVDVHSDKQKRKAMEKLVNINGVTTVSVDMEEKKFTVEGSMDPIELVAKLRKSWNAELISVERRYYRPSETTESSRSDKPYYVYLR